MILLVEDSEDDVFLMERALRKGEIQTPMQLARNGQEAVDYLAGNAPYTDRTQFPLPELVFLDLKLPYIHGLEVLRWMKKTPSVARIPVAILSSSLEETDRLVAKYLGADRFLVKPPTPEMIQDALKDLPNNG